MNAIKINYSYFFLQTDHCGDHCINYALSDPLDNQFQQTCIDHQHDVACDRCQLLPTAILNLKEILDKLAGNSLLHISLMCFMSIHVYM